MNYYELLLIITIIPTDSLSMRLSQGMRADAVQREAEFYGINIPLPQQLKNHVVSRSDNMLSHDEVGEGERKCGKSVQIINNTDANTYWEKEIILIAIII